MKWQMFALPPLKKWKYAQLVLLWEEGRQDRPLLSCWKVPMPV